MQQTEKYQFNLIESTDPIQPAPLNDNMEKVEAALGEQLHMALGHYQGSGEYGLAHPNTLTFDFTPKFLLVWMDHFDSGIGIRSENSFNVTLGNYTFSPTVTWGDRSVHWYTEDDGSQLNWNGYTYYYLALG